MKRFLIFLVNLRNNFWLSILKKMTTIQPQKVILWSTYGLQYSCSPKYIAEYLSKYHRGDFELFFAFTPNIMKEEVPKGVHKVQIHNKFRIPSLAFLYHLITAKFIITNFRSLGINGLNGKRKGQKYIMTYHCSYAIKPVEFETKDTEQHRMLLKKENEMTDLMLSSCPDRTNQIREAQAYQGEILEKGTPRVDIIFDNQQSERIKEKVYKYFGISYDAKILLYAPTFRDSNRTDLEIYDLDWEKIISAFEKRFNCKFYVLIRLHSAIANLSEHLYSSSRVFNSTPYSDIQELLVASYALITDYSSSPFDFVYTLRPCFSYCPDYEKYIKYDRATLRKDIKTLPFPYSETVEELVTAILNFDEKSYKMKLNDFVTNEMQSFENGQASRSLAEWMLAHKNI